MAFSFLNRAQLTGKHQVNLKRVGKSDSYTFLPFIKSFKHTFGPQIETVPVGSRGQEIVRISSVATEAYQVQLALPFVDDDNARDFFDQINELERTVVSQPTGEIGREFFLIEMRCDPLLKYPVYGIIENYDKEYSVDAGYSEDGYPMLINLSFTFKVNTLETAKRNGEKQKTIKSKGNKTSNSKKKGSGKATPAAKTDPANPKTAAKPKTAADKAKKAKETKAGQGALEGQATKSGDAVDTSPADDRARGSSRPGRGSTTGPKSYG